MKQPDPFESRVAGAIRAHGMLSGGESILVGVSGGADSVGLLRVLVSSAEPRPGRFVVAHVNHGWRGADSDGDARFVSALADALGLECFVHRPVSPRERATETEAAAREDRWDFFHALREREGLDRIAVGHNREDRAETFFLNLLRGAGSNGLGSMRPAAGPVIRPLIDVSRADIETYLRRIGQTWRTDRTNRDTRFARNRIRLDTFPALERAFNPRLVRTLGRTIDILEHEDAWMEQTVTDWMAPRVSRDGGDLVLHVSGLESQPVGFVRRVLRRALRLAGSPMRDVGLEHVERLRNVLAPNKSGRIIELPGAIGAERSFDTLRFFTPGPPPTGYTYRLPIPGRVEVPEIGAAIEASIVRPEVAVTDKPNGIRVFVNGESLGRCVNIRNWRDGDCYSPDGLPAAKLKTLFRQRRIPVRKRLQWPVVVAQSSIVWVASFPVSRDFIPTGHSRSVVAFEASRVSR